jgi:hypothetical protein
MPYLRILMFGFFIPNTFGRKIAEVKRVPEKLKSGLA